MSKLCLLLCLAFSVAVSAQEFVTARSAAGPISDKEAPIALGSRGVECKAEFKTVEASRGGKIVQIPIIRIELTNLDPFMEVDPKLKIMLEPLEGQNPLMQFVWLKRLAPNESVVYAWEMSDRQDLKTGAYRCYLTTFGSMGARLHLPVSIDFRLSSNPPQ